MNKILYKIMNFRRALKYIIQASPEALALQKQINSLEKPGVLGRANSEAMNNFSIWWIKFCTKISTSDRNVTTKSQNIDSPDL